MLTAVVVRFVTHIVQFVLLENNTDTGIKLPVLTSNATTPKGVYPSLATEKLKLVVAFADTFFAVAVTS